MVKFIAGLILCSSFMLAASSQTVDRSRPPKPQPAPVIRINDPESFTLPNGIQVLVVENHKAPKVTVSYTIDRTPVFEGKKAGIISILGEMLNEGTSSKSKAVFDEEADLIGASVNVTSSGGSVNALSKYIDRAVALMAEALQHPSFPAASLEKLRQQYIQGIKADEKSATAISTRVVNALNFGVSHPYGDFETEETLKSITLDDVKNAYSKYVTSDRGYLVFVGDIKVGQAKSIATRYFAGWKGNKLQLVPPPVPVQAALTELDVVDVPTAVQTVIKVTQPIDLRLSSPDYFGALLANEILGGGADSRLFKNLREKRGFTYSASSTSGNDRFGSGLFTAAASVRNAVTDSAVLEFVNELRSIRTQAVTPEELQNVKNYLSGRFALSFENPATIARFALNIAIEKLPKDFYRTYLQKINALTAADIQKVAVKYIPLNPRIILTGKASDFSSRLSALGYPVKYYDSYARPVDIAAGKIKKADPAVNASGIIRKYIDAMGGETALKAINSLNIDFDATAQGMSLIGNVKMMNPDKELKTVSLNGNTLVKTVFDGNKGYMEVQGQKKAMEPAEIKNKKELAGIFRQLNYNRPGYQVTIEGITKLGGEDAYKLTISSGAGKKITEFYDVKSGWLKKVESTEFTAGIETPTVIEYKDYKKYGNIYYASTWLTQAGPQSIEISVKAIRVNEAVTAADFN